MEDILEEMKEVNDDRIEQKAAEFGFADVMYERLRNQVAEFEEDLEKDEEIGAYLASFGKEIFVCIEDIGFENPYFIIFYGKVGDSKVQLIQHVTQLNVLFKAVKIKGREARRIGFTSSE